MIPPSFVILHGGTGSEILLLDYLYRVFLHLLAFGGVAVVVFWGSRAVAAVRSAFEAGRDVGEPER